MHWYQVWAIELCNETTRVVTDRQTTKLTTVITHSTHAQRVNNIIKSILLIVYTGITPILVQLSMEV